MGIFCPDFALRIGRVSARLKLRLLIPFLLIGSLVSAFGQLLPAGRYAQGFGAGAHLLVFTAGTNQTIALGWLNVNRITGAVYRQGTFYGQATNKPNGIIIGKFPGHGRLRGRVRDGGTNGVTGTMRLSYDGVHSFVRRFHVRPDPDLRSGEVFGH